MFRRLTEPLSDLTRGRDLERRQPSEVGGYGFSQAAAVGMVLSLRCDGLKGQDHQVLPLAIAPIDPR